MAEHCKVCGSFLSDEGTKNGKTVWKCRQCNRYYHGKP